MGGCLQQQEWAGAGSAHGQASWHGAHSHPPAGSHQPGYLLIHPAHPLHTPLSRSWCQQGQGSLWRAMAAPPSKSRCPRVCMCGVCMCGVCVCGVCAYVCDAYVCWPYVCGAYAGAPCALLRRWYAMGVVGSGGHRHMHSLWSADRVPPPPCASPSHRLLLCAEGLRRRHRHALRAAGGGPPHLCHAAQASVSLESCFFPSEGFV